MKLAFRSLLAASIAITSLPVLAQPVTKTLAPGVQFTQDINTNPKSALITNVLRVDPRATGVRIAAEVGQGGIIETDATKGRETISRLVSRTGALAGVNADFFPWTGDPLGLAIRGGEIISEPMGRAAIGFTKAGGVVVDRMTFEGSVRASGGLSYPLKAINRDRSASELAIYTPIFGPSSGEKEGIEVTLSLDGIIRPNADVTATVVTNPAAASGAAIPQGGAILSGANGAGIWISTNLHKGDRITLRANVRGASGTLWDDVAEAVGGGPMLLVGGEVRIDAAEESFKPDVVIGKHPRTAVGVNRSGEVLIVTVDGRQSISLGASLADMAGIMKRLGAVTAINLDGGGSTTLAIRGLVINSPSGGSERPVADALVVYSDSAKKSLPELAFADVGPISLTSADNRLITLVDPATSLPATEAQSSVVIWGTSGGIGFVNQKGYFTPSKTGDGKIIAIVGDQRLELPVTVLPSKPAKLAVKVEPDPSGAPNIATATVTVQDAKGNGVPGIPVCIKVTGGSPDAPTRITDKSGEASFLVTLDSTIKDAKVSVQAAGISAETK